MKPVLRTLIIEDSEDDAHLVVRMLKKGGYEVVAERVETAEAVARALAAGTWDVIIADYNLPRFNALAALRIVRAQSPDIPYIVVSGSIGEETAVATMRAGANDYVMKDKLMRLAPAVERELRDAELRRQQHTLEAQVHQEQALLNNLASTVPDHIYFKDRQSRFVRINYAMARRFGLPRPELAVGKTDFDIFSEEHARQAFSDEQRIMATGVPLVGIEEKETWPDGHVTWVSTTKVPLRNEAGEITGLVGISRDITEQKMAVERVREQAAMLDRASDAIYVTALDNTILYWNQAAGRIYGWSSAEAVGRLTTDLVCAGAVDAADVTAALFRTGDWSGERTQTTKSGKIVQVFSRMTLLRDDGGRPKSVLTINSDITEKKQLEARFMRAQRLESIGALASGIAHDLNNVLAPIIMGATLLRDAARDDTARNLVRMMEKSAERGAGIVRQVLTFARGSEGQRVSLQLRHLIQDMIKMADETFPKNIQVEDQSAAEVCPIEGDATQLHQALLNLCVNARDAMPEGGRLILAVENAAVDDQTAAQTPGAHPGAFVRLRVTDTGTGIPPEVQERIFEPFFTTKGVGKGTGLGLSTVLGIVKGHGGFIRLESRAGQGTTFDLYFPAAPAGRTPRGVGVADSSPPWQRVDDELVLVVDDEAAVREVARQALEEFGYRVIICGTGAEAVQVFRSQRSEVRLVVTDMMMPEMDGPTLVQALRQIEPAVPIVGITGVADAATMERLEGLSLVALVAKPFTIGQLLAAMRGTLPAGAPAGTAALRP